MYALLFLLLLNLLFGFFLSFFFSNTIQKSQSHTQKESNEIESGRRKYQINRFLPKESQKKKELKRKETKTINNMGVKSSVSSLSISICVVGLDSTGKSTVVSRWKRERTRMFDIFPTLIAQLHEFRRSNVVKSDFFADFSPSSSLSSF